MTLFPKIMITVVLFYMLVCAGWELRDTQTTDNGIAKILLVFVTIIALW